MPITTTAQITLLAATLLALFAMVRRDLTNLQNNGFSNSRYYDWLLESSEFSSPKRILAFAVLLGSFTTMALTSWMVIMLLAAVIAMLGIAMLLRRQDKPAKLSGRAAGLYIATMLIASLSIAAAHFISKLTGLEGKSVSNASTVALVLLVMSPLVVMAANWLLRPFERNRDKIRPDQEQKQP